MLCEFRTWLESNNVNDVILSDDEMDGFRLYLRYRNATIPKKNVIMLELCQYYISFVNGKECVDTKVTKRFQDWLRDLSHDSESIKKELNGYPLRKSKKRY
jgi:hypothetical protein